MNKIQYWLTRNYYVWLASVILSLPFNVVLAYIKEFGRVTSELFTEITSGIPRLKSYWENQKIRVERQMKRK